MGNTIAMDIGELRVGQQYLIRQSAHVTALNSYLESNAKLENGDVGLLGRPGVPIVNAAADLAKRANDLVGTAVDLAAAGLGATVTTFIEHERAVHGRLSDAARKALKNPEQLGPSPDSASAPVYGPEFVGGGAASIDDQNSRVSTEVVEKANPRAKLVPPSGDSEDMADIVREHAGHIGWIDGKLKEFFGISIIDGLVNPFEGNWSNFTSAQDAWSKGGDFYTALGTNFTGLSAQLESWKGGGHLAFAAIMDLYGKVAREIGQFYPQAGEALGKLLLAFQAIAKLVGQAIEKIAIRVEKLIAKICVPFVGQAAAIWEIPDAWDDIKKLYDEGKAAIEDVQKAFETIEKLKAKFTSAVEKAEGLKKKVDHFRSAYGSAL